MDINKIDNILMNMQGVSKRIVEKWSWIKYLVNEKMFALIHKTDKERLILTIKNSKGKLNEMRVRYPAKIVEAFEMEPLHWNSLYLDAGLSENVILKAINESYNLIIADFSPIAKLAFSSDIEDYNYLINTKNNKDFLKVKFSSYNQKK